MLSFFFFFFVVPPSFGKSKKVLFALVHESLFGISLVSVSLLVVFHFTIPQTTVSL
jgi:hypothetical protein